MVKRALAFQTGLCWLPDNLGACQRAREYQAAHFTKLVELNGTPPTGGVRFKGLLPLMQYTDQMILCSYRRSGDFGGLGLEIALKVKVLVPSALSYSL